VLDFRITYKTAVLPIQKFFPKRKDGFLFEDLGITPRIKCLRCLGFLFVFIKKEQSYFSTSVAFSSCSMAYFVAKAAQ